ncbi:MAG: DNA polymerase III subunit delta' [Candidatus Omnitrophica bacterium]|nr:DNA polymerase III subunit delta' [Candidatus Omnitrophota bacterium]
MSFNDIRGQDNAIAFLRSSIAGGTVANAYLFYGLSGIGKKLTALNFAKSLNCANPDHGTSCDTCPSCRKIDSASHPDVRLVTPEKEGSSVRIGDIRPVIEDSGLKPYESAKKAYIIDEANQLTEEASNALLKTLEEPSPQTVFILIAESAAALLPTIRSRCQAVKFFPLGSVVVKGILMKDYGMNGLRAHIASSLACGSVKGALAFRDEKFFDKRARILDALELGTLSDWDFDRTAKTDLKAQLEIMLTWYRDLLVVKSGGSGIMNIDREDAVFSRAGKTGFDKLHDAINRIVATQAYLENNANPKLAMAALEFSI